MIKRAKELYLYKEMILNLVRREVRGKYQKSILGMLWMFINPLFQVLVFTIVFTYIFPSNIENYPVHLIVALIPWTFFADSMISGANVVVNNANLVKKVYFPKEVLIISTVISKLINMLLSFIIVFIFILIAKIPIDPLSLLSLPLIIVIEYILVTGLVFLVSAACVYLRDIEHITAILMQAWVWATPVMYSIKNIKGPLLNIIYLNPFTPIILAFRDVLYYSKLPNFVDILMALVISIIVFIIGGKVFSLLEPSFAEEL